MGHEPFPALPHEMSVNKEKYPDLNDLAFSGRNKDYGSFSLRKKYPRLLFRAFILAVVFLLLLTTIPLSIYYFRGQELPLTTEEVYSVDYNFIPSPEDDLNSLAKAIAKPPPAAEPVPEVVDTVIPEKKNAVEEEKKEEEKDVKADSTGNSTGITPNGTGSSEEGGIYTTLDVYPMFPGGPQALLLYLRTNIQYPALAMKMGVQGEVMVVFMVETDGSVTNVSVTKGISKECDEEAIRVFKTMPRWEPGRRYGKPVRVHIRMPVVFNNPRRK